MILKSHRTNAIAAQMMMNVIVITRNGVKNQMSQFLRNVRCFISLVGFELVDIYWEAHVGVY